MLHLFLVLVPRTQAQMIENLSRPIPPNETSGSVLVELEPELGEGEKLARVEERIGIGGVAGWATVGR